ncbi:MAG: hypothetical protein ACOY99_05860 [Pseudomonadota bacterium]|jgi:uncharacterized membrane protein YbaN (DUF454 family)
MARLVLLALGGLFLLLGLLFALLPMVPLGLPFIVLALICLMPVSRRVRGVVISARRRWRPVDSGVQALTRSLPSPYRRILRQTDPGHF